MQLFLAAERAHKGQFMLTEATLVAANGHGYPNTPGIYTDEQKAAWKPIVEAVKDKGAIFFCQIWHCGRASHSVYNAGPLRSLLPLYGSLYPLRLSVPPSTALCTPHLSPFRARSTLPAR